MPPHKDTLLLLRDLHTVNTRISRCLDAEDRLFRELEGMNSAYIPERSQSAMAERRRRDREGSQEPMDVDLDGQTSDTLSRLVQRVAELKAEIKQERQLRSDAEAAIDAVKTERTPPFTVPSLVDAMILVSDMTTDAQNTTA